MTVSPTALGLLQILPGVAPAKQLTLGHHQQTEAAWPGARPLDCVMKKGDVLLLSACAPSPDLPPPAITPLAVGETVILHFTLPLLGVAIGIKMGVSSK